jgi:hypothetical protein
MDPIFSTTRGYRVVKSAVHSMQALSTDVWLQFRQNAQVDEGYEQKNKKVFKYERRKLKGREVHQGQNRRMGLKVLEKGQAIRETQRSR